MLRWSWFAGSVTLIYLCAAVYVVRDELRYTGGGWINLRGMGTTIITAPSSATLGTLFEGLGIRKVDYNDPGFSGYLQLAIHVLVTAAVVYFVALGLQLLLRRLLSPQ